jgi:hypothetical protein
MELRTIKFDKKYFECQGRKFTIKDTLGFVRWKKLEEYSLEFTFSATPVDIFKQLGVIQGKLNELRLFDSVVIVNNLMVGIKNLVDKENISFRICALFMDAEGEDATVYDEGLMKEKIDCWSKELAAPPFIQWAANCIPGWFPIYKIVSQDGLKEAVKQE